MARLGKRTGFASALRPIVALAIVAVAGIGLAARPAAAAEQARTARPPIVDARAERLLAAMGESLAAAKQLSFQARLAYEDVLPSGQKIEHAALQDVALRRPDRVYIESTGDTGSHRLWYDGKQVTLLDPQESVYAVAPMPGRIDQAVERLVQQYGFTAPLSDFLYPNPAEVLRKRVQFGLYVGETDVDGVRCHQLAFVDKDLDWQIWIEAGPQLLPRKLVITYTQLANQPRFAATFSHWDLDSRISDSVFQPLLPPDAGRVDFVQGAKELKEDQR